MNLILDIPSHIRSSILAEWLEINDLARLDVAIVKGSQRHEYLNQLSLDRIALSGTPKISPKSSVLDCLQWLAERQLCVRSVKFSAAAAADEVRAVLQIQLAVNGLEEIEFERLDGVDATLFQRLITHCRNISRINLSFCSHLTDSYFKETTVHDARLLLSDDQTDASSDSNTSESAQMPTRLVLSNLRHLILNNCSGLTDDGIYSVSQLAPSLTKLHCRGISRLTDESLRFVAQMPHLEDIDFGLCRLLTDKGVRYLAQSKNRAVLTSVNFYYCRNISDQALIELAGHHPMIQTLNVAGCHLLTDTGLSRVATQCREHLQHLNVAGCGKLTHESIAIIATHCPQLRMLNLSNVKSTDDKCVQLLWKNCEHMEMLCLKECDRVTDNAFKDRSFMWPKLKHLDLTYCTEVGDPGMLQIAMFCPALKMLRMTGCKLSLPCLRRATSMNEHLHINIEQE